jgi:RNA polymerase sigma-70 factor (ECF subfamily)
MNDIGPLLEKEIPPLRRYALALTRNSGRADDLVQETLVRAIAKQDCWRWGSNLRAWLFTIMHNQNVNAIRCAVRDGTAIELDDTWPFLVAPVDPTAPLLLRDLDRALARMSEDQRRVILLIGFDGMSYGQAAKILDAPIGTIRSRLSRGRAVLRKLLDGITGEASGQAQNAIGGGEDVPAAWVVTRVANGARR